MMRTATLSTKKNRPTSEQEEEFQVALKEYRATGSKQAWDIMWLRVYECCKAIAIKKAPGKRLLEERSMDATIKIMDRIRRFANPAKLSSYCYWPTIEAIQGKAAVQEDQELQLHEEYEEQTQLDKGYETVRGVYREEMDK